MMILLMTGVYFFTVMLHYKIPYGNILVFGRMIKIVLNQHRQFENFPEHRVCAQEGKQE